MLKQVGLFTLSKSEAKPFDSLNQMGIFLVFFCMMVVSQTQHSAYLHIFAHVSTLLSVGILYLSTANPGYLPGILKVGEKKDPGQRDAREAQQTRTR